jgi:serine/threonine protein kinase
MVSVDKNPFRLDDFEFIPWFNKEIIGRGAFSTVYHVRHKATGQCYALKKVIFELKFQNLNPKSAISPIFKIMKNS